MPRRAELTIDTGGRQLAEQVFVKIALGVAFGQWQLVDHVGLDPLAMLRPVEALYQGLLEGLSSVTIRLRYYSFLNWWVRHYRQTNGSSKASDFDAHIRIGEALVGLVSKAAGQPDGIAGDLELTKILEATGDIIDLQNAADRYLKKPVYYGVYGTQMADMGMHGYLEVHHTRRLSDNGPDDLRWFWARGYFSTTSGNVTDDIILQYLELHSKRKPTGVSR